ncbi:MAG: hypothetical protein RL308_476 [Bacteroidota bacterium]|jgi:hypothetical protein
MNSSQLIALEEGRLQRKRLIKGIERAVTSDLNLLYPHTYIFSPPGLGKSFTINKFLKGNDIIHFEITGAQSMFAFGINLATIKYNYPDEKVIIVVDDCDTLFKNEENINIMKNILSGNRSYTYQKNIESQISSLGEMQYNAVQHFRIHDQIGFRVALDNFVFIFSSNFKLPTDEEAFNCRNKSIKKTHLNAIRSRCNTIDFELNKFQHYGWITDVVLSEFDDINALIKDKIFNWVWYNWENLNERSLRTIEKMIQTYKNDPESYIDMWCIDFLRNIER